MSNINQIIDHQIKKDSVVLYMKGSPTQPSCGYSATISAILNDYPIKYQTYNVLDDDALRQGIKAYSNWPTIPQLYINEVFIGGCDIITQMHQEGTLAQLLKIDEILEN
jgi:monothiol glutaredoxin